ncbi:MAG: class I SAM-dependent methyltransferase [Crocosphaera sp.]
MTNHGSYYFENPSPTLDKEVERLKYQAELTWDKEARNLSWFGVQDGMSVVELGSGGGFITQKLLHFLPDSSITIIDISPVMLEHSRTYLQSENQGYERVTFIEASITHTNLPDNSFDVAYGRLIFQHLPDPMTAAKEVYRILKPGGKIIITDIDNELLWLSQPSIREASFILDKTTDIQAKLGGNRLIGRKLWSILQQTGFQNLDLETILSHSGNFDIEEMLIHFDAFVSFLEKSLTEEEEQIINTSKEKLMTASNPFVGFLSLMAFGEKPH